MRTGYFGKCVAVQGVGDGVGVGGPSVEEYGNKALRETLSWNTTRQGAHFQHINIFFPGINELLGNRRTMKK